MLNLDDMQLLAEYAARNSEEAFSTLVARYVNLVYSAALRQTGNPHEAQEITQAVFLVLARKAKTLRQGTVLSGWLYHTARLTAANALRGEIRRQNREQQAYMQSTLNQPEPDHWQQVGPLLEQAMSGLSDADRNAIVLRYFENKPLKEVGAALGASDDAAKMRVNRALEKLRKFFVKRGVTLSAAALGAAISAHSVQAAPAGLSTAVIAAACQGSALTASTLTLAKGTLKIMAWTKFHLAVGTAAVAVIALQYVKIENQRQETVALQGQLQRAAQQSEKQLASIKELETRDETMARSLRTVVRESTQSVARKAAAPAPVMAANPPAVSTEGKGLGSMLENMMKDPDFLKAMTEPQAQMLKTQYAPLVKQLNLTPEQRDAFYAALMDNATNAMSQALVMMSGTNKAGATGVLEDAQKSLQDQMRSLLGDSGFAQFQEYQTTIPDRQLLDSMKTSFADNPLTDDQQQRLLQIMVNERKNSIMPLDPNTGKPVVLEANPAAQMEQTLQTQDQINQRVYQQAANFLSPAQLQSLGTSQTNMLGLVKSMMPMMQKMLGTDDKAGQ
ncbi:MAG TPA: sigma-70 family RNA polymerase sigma factor [Candidatus Acidoferrum sp.]|nr:sigma-70 family RNA polymerase sigma factor [Candidatus Acidoferrum sp.]